MCFSWHAHYSSWLRFHMKNSSQIGQITASNSELASKHKNKGMLVSLLPTPARTQVTSMTKARRLPPEQRVLKKREMTPKYSDQDRKVKEFPHSSI